MDDRSLPELIQILEGRASLLLGAARASGWISVGVKRADGDARWWSLRPDDTSVITETRPEECTSGILFGQVEAGLVARGRPLSGDHSNVELIGDPGPLLRLVERCFTLSSPLAVRCRKDPAP